MRSPAQSTAPRDAAGDRWLNAATRAVVAIVLVGVAINVAFAFVGLGTDSFWVDELFTAWVVDTPGIAETIRRIWSDVHPPLYYLAAYGWTRLFGIGEVSLRSFSALTASGAVAFLLLGFRDQFGLPARAIAAAAAVTSIYWFEHAQNGRMYALGALLGLVFIRSMLIAIAELRTGGLTARTKRAVVVSAFLYAFTHFYMFLGVEAGLAMVLPLARSRSDRRFVAGLAAVVAMLMLLFVATLLHQTSVDVADTWFSNQPWRLRKAIVEGLFHRGLRPAAEIALLGVLAATVAWRLRELRSWRPADAELRVLWCGAVPCLVVAGGLVVSFALAPSVSDRNVAAVTPFLWLSCAAIVDLAAVTLPPAGRLAAILVLSATIATDAFHLDRRWLPKREEFRKATAFITSRPQCEDATIPIIVRGQIRYSPEMRNAPYYYERFYYFRNHRNPVDLIGVSQDGTAPMPGALRSIIARRIAGQDPCDVVGLVLHIRPGLLRSIALTYGHAGLRTDRIGLRRFANYRMREEGAPKEVGAVVLLARRPAP